MDGIAQTDFSKFQVTGTHTLSLVTGGPGADYIAWIAHYPGFSDTDPTHDPDHDGLSNQQEYAFGLDPTNGSSCNPVTQPLDPATGRFQYTRRAGTGLIYQIYTTINLGLWARDTGATEVAVTTSGDVQTVTVQVTTAPVNGKLFVRVQAR